MERWEREHPGTAWRTPADVLAHFGTAVEAHNGALAGGVPDDMTFLFRTQEDAGAFAARDPRRQGRPEKPPVIPFVGQPNTRTRPDWWPADTP